jgi:hypothetical protein
MHAFFALKENYVASSHRRTDRRSTFNMFTENFHLLLGVGFFSNSEKRKAFIGGGGAAAAVLQNDKM